VTVVRDEVRDAVRKEQAAAERVHGLHHSHAEKYSVMLEELEEAEEELRSCRRFIEGMWQGVRYNRSDWAVGHACRVAEAAERAACECIQLAAMARKEVGPIPPPATYYDDSMGGLVADD